jgi:hypothetical protein
MPDVNGYYPPVQYSLVWLLVAGGIVVLVTLWFIFVFFSTRNRQEEASVMVDPLPGLPRPGPELHERYIRLVDDVERAHATGDIDFATAHQELSRLVREFAHEARGVRAQYMTLDELRAYPNGPLSSTVSELYPGSFSGREVGTVAHAAERARRLVREWT